MPFQRPVSGAWARRRRGRVAVRAEEPATAAVDLPAPAGAARPDWGPQSASCSTPSSRSPSPPPAPAALRLGTAVIDAPFLPARCSPGGSSRSTCSPAAGSTSASASARRGRNSPRSGSRSTGAPRRRGRRRSVRALWADDPVETHRDSPTSRARGSCPGRSSGPRRRSSSGPRRTPAWGGRAGSRRLDQRSLRLAGRHNGGDDGSRGRPGRRARRGRSTVRDTGLVQLGEEGADDDGGGRLLTGPRTPSGRPRPS